MKLVRALDRVISGRRRRVVTLGNFDGVHRAHQAICRRVVEATAELGAESVAITFHPHPVAVLAPERAPALLLGVRDRLRFLAALGIDLIVAQRFDRKFACISAEEFVRRYLVERLRAVRVIVGHNVRFGRDRGGDGELLRRMGAELGYGVEVVGPVRVGAAVVSSTAIRQAIGRGDLAHASALLGREHFVRGRVVRGSGRGVTLGFPTANLRVSRGMLPPNGVYAVRAARERATYGGIANLGFRPTFGAGARSLEAHLFGFSGDLYGERLRLYFVKRLRGERKFPGAAELSAQIRRDVQEARAALEGR